MDNRDVALISVFAALYAALGIVFPGFTALQFRLAGVLRPGIARKRELAVAYMVGVVAVNVFSPYAGVHELVFMPVMSLLSGLGGYELAKRFNHNYYVCGAVIAVIIPLSVAWMLNQLANLPMVATLPGLLVSEQIINVLGATIFRLIETRYKWWEI